MCYHEIVRHSHMSLSLMMPQKYCGFSTKLDKPESSVLSSEDGGLAPKFMKRRETARSSSVPRTDEPVDTRTECGSQAANSMLCCIKLTSYSMHKKASTECLLDPKQITSVLGSGIKCKGLSFKSQNPLKL